jgi:hypothetical protein
MSVTISIQKDSIQSYDDIRNAFLKVADVASKLADSIETKCQVSSRKYLFSFMNGPLAQTVALGTEHLNDVCTSFFTQGFNNVNVFLSKESQVVFSKENFVDVINNMSSDILVLDSSFFDVHPVDNQSNETIPLDGAASLIVTRLPVDNGQTKKESFEFFNKSIQDDGVSFVVDVI